MFVTIRCYRVLAVAVLSCTLAAFGRNAVIDVKAYGATGNGSTDDTAAIRSAISALITGGELYFPCGTYLISSGLTITQSKVAIAGASGCATIKASGNGYTMLQVGSPSLSAASALSATSAELSTTFSSDLALEAGDYVLLQEGGKDYSTDSAPGHDTNCDLSGCRGEMLQIQSVSGNTATVTTKLHHRYDPGANGAKVAKLTSPTTDVVVHDLTFDGSGTASTGLYMVGTVNSTVSNLKANNFVNSGLQSYYGFNLAWNNVAVSHAGSGESDAFLLVAQGRPSVLGATLTSLNSTAFGMGLHTVADGTFSKITVDKTGTTSGRPFKLAASSDNQFNDLTITNGASSTNHNGLSLTYYSSHNTFVNCVVTNNSSFAGIMGFGNYNQYNRFVNCTVNGNGQWQLGHSASKLGQYDDAYWEISGGTYTGVGGQTVLQINGPHAYIHDVAINGPGTNGIVLGTTAQEVCVLNNTFSPKLTGFNILDHGSRNRFNNNITAGPTDPPLLPRGACIAQNHYR
jgi:polygalacturonase